MLPSGDRGGRNGKRLCRVGPNKKRCLPRRSESDAWWQSVAPDHCATGIERIEGRLGHVNLVIDFLAQSENQPHRRARRRDVANCRRNPGVLIPPAPSPGRNASFSPSESRSSASPRARHTNGTRHHANMLDCLTCGETKAHQGSVVTLSGGRANSLRAEGDHCLDSNRIQNLLEPRNRDRLIVALLIPADHLLAHAQPPANSVCETPFAIRTFAMNGAIWSSRSTWGRVNSPDFI